MKTSDKLFVAAIFALLCAFAAMVCNPGLVQSGYKVPPQEGE